MVTHESRKNLIIDDQKPHSIIDVSLGYLPNERYKRNVVRGHFDLVGESKNFSDTMKTNFYVFELIFKIQLLFLIIDDFFFFSCIVSIGGSFGLFVGASLLSFIEIFYYFTIRAGLFNYINVFKKKFKLSDVFSRLRMRSSQNSQSFNQHNE